MSDLSKDLVAASVIPLVLSVLAEGESYGYDIIKKVKTLSDDQLHWKEGTLYPVLHKLEQRGFIASEWKQSEEGRKRKYYAIKEEGRNLLAEEIKNWQTIIKTLNKLWKQNPLLT